MSKIEELQQKYRILCHAMQSGVAMKMNYDDSETTPKHLRTGVNSAMVDNSALARLLIQKGIITEEEYFQSLCDVMQEEVDSYEQYLKQRIGGNIKLG